MLDREMTEISNDGFEPDDEEYIEYFEATDTTSDMNTKDVEDIENAKNNNNNGRLDGFTLRVKPKA